MRRPGHVFALAIVIVAWSPLSAFAVEHLLAGTMLSSRNRAGRAKFVWVSRDAAVALPASPASSVGATLVVSASDGDTATITLGSGGWSETAGVATYSNRAAPGGDSVCKAAVIRDAKLVKVVCRTDPIDTLDGGAHGGVAVRLTVGPDDYCASFGGTIRERAGNFRAKGAPAPPACDVTPTTTTTTTTTTSSTIIVYCATTTLIPYCGSPAFRSYPCAAERCPGSQTCGDDGTGRCGACTGPPVPCGGISHPQMCQFGECPPGMQCRDLYRPPACSTDCACQ